MYSRHSRCRSAQRGSAMLEFGLLVSLLTIILAGAMEFSRVFYSADEVVNAARAGVQYGLQSTSSETNYTGMQTAAKADGGDVSGLSATASQFCLCTDGTTTSCATGVCTMRTYIKVAASGTFQTIGKYPYFPQSVALGNTAIIRVK
jgi:Flp pilus assembly protein TadG